MTAPHDYVPDGPVEAAPYRLLPARGRQEAFAAVLEGVDTGAYDSGW